MSSCVATSCNSASCSAFHQTTEPTACDSNTLHHVASPLHALQRCTTPLPRSIRVPCQVWLQRDAERLIQLSSTAWVLVRRQRALQRMQAGGAGGHGGRDVSGELERVVHKVHHLVQRQLRVRFVRVPDHLHASAACTRILPLCEVRVKARNISQKRTLRGCKQHTVPLRD
jgi:hypothetical protein